MKISGILQDNYGVVDGATIIVLRNGKRTNVAVISDQNGKFNIENDQIKDSDLVEIRYLGNKTIIKPVTELKGETKIIPMEEDIEELDEVIITNNIENNSKPIELDYTPNIKQPISPVLIFSVLALVTFGTIIFVIKQSK
mgnify:CR=1 FL=1|tara:strand:- start:4794 stop:5213 length:420 start_codon:yes stop_codon:yes gene_type:complete